jgi:putative transposase
MPYRKTKAYTDEVYHVYNRGVAKQNVFFRPGDYIRFERILNYYKAQFPPLSYSKFLELKNEAQQEVVMDLESGSKLVGILAYCLMPNHYHLIIKQLVADGITTFVRRSANSYTKYINTRIERVGPLFQGPYKLKHVTSDEQLIHLSKYIHINPIEARITTSSNLIQYQHSSFPQYCKQKYSGMLPVSTKDILAHFKSATEYRYFVLDKSMPDDNTQEMISMLMID